MRMTVFNVTDLFAAMPPLGRVIGIDPGAKTIGLALSDVRRRLATPYGSLKRRKLSENAAKAKSSEWKYRRANPGLTFCRNTWGSRPMMWSKIRPGSI